MASSTASGASRRSHTKSRKGCKTCKRRHIRCDENFPQCRNCVKHQVRCDYMDLVTNEDPQQQQPELYWSPEIDSILDSWQRTGYCTLGGYSIDLRVSGHKYTKSDLHLIYHALCAGQNNASNQFTVWTRNTPKFLEVATSQPFLVHAILGFGSLAVAWEKNSNDAKALAYFHGSIALQGLQDAIGAFSVENADAILAASILLSWQANDWRSWVSLICGIRTLTKSMQTWRNQSRLVDILDEQDMAIHSDFPSIPQAQNPEEARSNHTNILEQIYMNLDCLVSHLGNGECVPYVEQLKDYIQRLLNVRPAQTPEEEFNQLYAFRKWLFWIPATLLRSETRNYMTLVVLAHFYATAVTFESLYPSVASAFCSTIALRPLEEIFRSFEAAHRSPRYYSQDFMGLQQLLDWPRQVAASYKQQKQNVQSQIRTLPLHGFESLSSELAMLYEQQGFGTHPSPAMGPSSQVSSEMSSHGSPFLDIPSISSSSPSSFGSHYSSALGTLPSMATELEPSDFYGFGSHENWRGFVNPTALWT